MPQGFEDFLVYFSIVFLKYRCESGKRDPHEYKIIILKIRFKESIQKYTKKSISPYISMLGS